MKDTNVLFDFPFPEERVFRYQAMQDILHHLVNNPFEEFTQQELASITGADVSSVSRSITLLKKLGVIAVSNHRPARISIDTDHLQRPDPIFLIPQSKFRKPVRAYLDELETRIQESEEIDELVGTILFGSVARGTADRRSDIDLLVIIDGDLTYGRRICTSLAREIEDKSFGGHRYEFEVLVETPETAVSHSTELTGFFDEGLVLTTSPPLQELRQDIYTQPHGGA
ncbi:nucleotidyltransferase [Halorubrum ezzemoulense]|uniref:Nucleotidyltransferase n=1 Tax=Halorubrum ezzemoulense TaxID=337243 RepID=A0A256IPE6_HALEZ|nr:nucleotidyltransferase domain-containing protein [Halorubrum ezzemoulense]MDB9235705.1 nucleotidyltransferase domain-containing protein [Halorubrum ezzemoulense]OYR58438.1 nucleotidyltransferase [Halorubrum ezzemoulense]